MSRHPSPAPGPSHRVKQKPGLGITAGAEDVKYQQKYKELKRKVKEIEQDNDKLQFKVLQAKRNIQRMKLERAILYERLSGIPPSPEPNTRPLPRQQIVDPPRRSSATDPRHLPPLSHSHIPPQPPSPRSSRYHAYPENNLPPMQHHQYSPPADRDRDRERTRPAPLSPPRVHNHQRLGPGTYINAHDRERDIDWEREAAFRRERERERSSPVLPRHSHPHPHYGPEHHLSSARSDPYYLEQPVAPQTSAARDRDRVSRSDTPNSGSASASAGEIPSRPDSRGPYLERDRDRDRSAQYRLRPVEEPPQAPGPGSSSQRDQAALDFVHEDGRTQAHQAQSRDREREREREMERGGRKRTRSDAADMSPMVEDSYPSRYRDDDVRMGPP
ncbi:hypothetical protein VKT23_001787 [Stygiomarasmius scandens]|uniref:INO80 complex subunit F domain-containing protein n=1 Tax=Marasmiellus scandens TaxID=2682957 RepID=A0ABR1K3N8_9AGAR